VLLPESERTLGRCARVGCERPEHCRSVCKNDYKVAKNRKILSILPKGKK